MGQHDALARDVDAEIGLPFDVDEVDPRVDGLERRGGRAAAIREDDRLRRRGAERVEIDGAEVLGAQLDQIAIRRNRGQRCIERLLVNRGNEFHRQ